jgi:hypothetical protein
MRKILDIPEDTFAMLLNYSRFQIDLREDVKSMHGVELENSFPNPNELIQSRDSNLELTEKQWEEIQDIIDICEDMKAKDNLIERLPEYIDSRPIMYDEDGYAYKLSDEVDWDTGKPFRNYLEMGN